MPPRYIDDHIIKPFEYKEFDSAVKPEHYHKGDIDVIEFLERFFPDAKYTVVEGFHIGNIIKYVCRHKEKGGLEDLKKAENYLHKLMGK
jgi:hypothetical protein